jgi:hypothetical protein
MKNPPNILLIAVGITLTFFAIAIFFNGGPRTFTITEVSAAGANDFPFAAKRINRVVIKGGDVDTYAELYVEEVRGKWLKVRNLKKEYMTDTEEKPYGEAQWVNSDFVTTVYEN